MDFLRNIASAALQSTGVTFPYAIGAPIPGLSSSTSIWDIRQATKRDDGQQVTLFIFDSTLPALQPGNRDRKALLNLARNALKKLRTIRHPDVLKYVDGLETETHVYIATEPVRPLAAVLEDWDAGRVILGDASEGGKNKQRGREEWIAWGVKSIGTALAFLNSPPLSQHHATLIPSSLFITAALEWRLGGFEVLSTNSDGAAVLWGMGSLLPGGAIDRSAPEIRKAGWGVLRDADPALTDGYMLALLIFSLFNPDAPVPNLTTAAPQPSQTGSMPRALFPVYKRMLNPNAKTRLPTTQFIDEASRTGFWSGNALIELVDALEGFQLATEADKLALLRRIKESSNSIPPPFLTGKILPSLLHSLSLPGAPAGAILPLVLSIGRNVSPDMYRTTILDPVCRLYASPDRGTRMALLEGLSEYSEKLDKSMVSDKIWPNLITGFADTVAVIREATVKAVPLLAPKLSDRILNNELLRLLAKMQTDPEPSIRTNTCILLGRIAPLLGPNTKKKVLVPAFARSLKDTFVHARVAGLMALMATVDFYDKEDLAGRVVPNMSFTLVDKEKLVRDQAFKAMQMFVSRLEKAAAEMPDTVAIEGVAANGTATTTTLQNGQAGQGGLVNSATGAAGALAGWAIASLGKQLPHSQAHSAMSVTASSPVIAQLTDPSIASRAGPHSNGHAVPPAAASPSAPAHASFGGATRPTAASARSSGGMKLGGSGLGSSKAVHRASGPTLEDVLAGEEDDDNGTAANAWGDDDLIDVNADEDDWSAFETAPTPMEPPAPAPAIRLTPQVKPKPSVKPPVASTSTSTSSSASPAPTTRSRVPDVVVPDLDDPWANGQSSTASPAPPVATSGWSDSDNARWDDVPSHPGRPAARPLSPAGSNASSSAAAAVAAANVPLAALSKEDKEKEMARRREERKARIAAMKESKKGAK